MNSTLPSAAKYKVNAGRHGQEGAMQDGTRDIQAPAPTIRRLPAGWFRPRREEWLMLAFVVVGIVICLVTSGEIDLFSVGHSQFKGPVCAASNST
jgi:hypothetical protein